MSLTYVLMRSATAAYFRSQTVPDGDVEAAEWYRKGADWGVADARYKLGAMLYSGKGVPQDYAEAAKWLHLAADEVHMAAKYLLGVMYSRGHGVQRDDAKALTFLRQAAYADIAGAQNDLGLMYYHGQGVPQNFVLAHMCFNLAASKFPATEAAGRDDAIKNREEVASKMSLDQIAEAQRLASVRKPKF